jgi:CheY-like chemotaxis protein
MNDSKRILLVEDQPGDVELTLAAFAKFNLPNPIDTARDGVEALDYLCCRGAYARRESGNPAVVLLDLKMPRMNGLETLRRIKTDPRLKRIPIVMLTSSREDPDLTASYDFGVNAYVVKPVDYLQFMEAIKQLGLFWSVLNEQPPENRAHTNTQP